MNTKNYLTHTKKYKILISSIHSIYRLVNSTFEVKDMVNRLAKLICQIFNVKYCLVLLLDPSKKYSAFKCLVSYKKRYLIDKKTKITNRLEKKIIKTLTAVRKNNLLAFGQKRQNYSDCLQHFISLGVGFFEKRVQSYTHF